MLNARQTAWKQLNCDLLCSIWRLQDIDLRVEHFTSNNLAILCIVFQHLTSNVGRNAIEFCSIYIEKLLHKKAHFFM